MGCSHSKQAKHQKKTNRHDSADSRMPLKLDASLPPSPLDCRIPQSTQPNRFSIHAIEGHSDVTRPPPPPRIRRLSELIDPADIPIDYSVRSPSGNLLAPEQFLARPNRPLSIRERQAEIQKRVRQASRLGEQAETVQNDAVRRANEDSMGWRSCCGCFA
jgi:hypothetical protein